MNPLQNSDAAIKFSERTVEEAKAEYLKVGRALYELTKTWTVTIAIISLIAPVFARRFSKLIDAIEPLVRHEDFGSDEELGI